MEATPELIEELKREFDIKNYHPYRIVWSGGCCSLIDSEYKYFFKRAFGWNEIYYVLISTDDNTKFINISLGSYKEEIDQIFTDWQTLNSATISEKHLTKQQDFLKSILK